MVTSPEANIPLTDEDSRKLELGSQRLKVVQAEVLEATKKLASYEAEMNQAREAKEYAESEKIQVEIELSELRTQKEELKSSVKTLRQELNKHADEHEAHRVYHDSMNASLLKRQEHFSAKEKEFSSERELHVQKEKELEKRRLQVEQAREKFQDAITSVTW